MQQGDFVLSPGLPMFRGDAPGARCAWDSLPLIRGIVLYSFVCCRENKYFVPFWHLEIILSVILTAFFPQTRHSVPFFQLVRRLNMEECLPECR
jgi:hypothetical protein